MKTIIKEIKAYEFKELSPSAKEKVKEWYLSDDARNDIFYEDCMMQLQKLFKNSDLKIQYSLSYSQGDGFNIYGTLLLTDFLEIWKASEKEKRTMQYYIKSSSYEYLFDYNSRYCYSQKFIDKKYITDVEDEFIENLKFNGIKNIKHDIISKFYSDMINYFEELDHKFEKAGYDFLYDCDDDEIIDFCDANEYYFDEYGVLI